MSSPPTSSEKVDEKTDTPTKSSLEVADGEISEITHEDEEVDVGWRTWMAAISGASCVFSGYYTGLILGNTASTVMTSFGRPDLAIWMPNEFAIITAALGGLIGSCSDKVGRKNILLIGISIACIGDIIIATAQNVGSVLVGAALSAGIFVNQGNFFSIPAEVLPRRYRGIGATITVSGGGLGATVAFLFSGATIQNNTGGLEWRSTFILGACIHFLAAMLLILFYRPLESPNKSGKSASAFLLTQVDWIGAFLLAAGVGLFMIGLTMGGVLYPWASGPVLGTLCAGAATMLILALHQTFVNKHGILDHELWTRNFCVASFGCFVEGVVFYALLLFFPLETMAFWEHRGVFWLDLRLLTFFLTSAVVAPFVGWYTRYTRDLKYPLLAGWTLVLIGFIVLTTATQKSNYTSVGGLLIVGVGFSTPLALLFAVAQLATAPHLLGLTTGQLISARAVGQAIGASVLVAVFQAKLKSILPTEVSKAATDAGLPLSSLPVFLSGISSQNKTLIESAPGVTTKIIEAGTAAATDAYVKSFHYGWYTALPFAILALLLVLLLDGKKIKAQMTWLVERPVAGIHRHHVEYRASL